MANLLSRTNDNPWKLKTPPGASAYRIYIDENGGTGPVRTGAQRQKQPDARQVTAVAPRPSRPGRRAVG